MAAPASVSLQDLTGNFTLNKKLSSSPEAMLVLQGIGWVARKALSMAPITLHVKQFSEEGEAHVHIAQTAPGGIQGALERRAFNGKEVEYELPTIGKIKGRSSMVALESIDDSFLKKNWVLEAEGTLMRSCIDSVDNGWSANQVWGFQEIGGKRHYCRNIVLLSGKGKKDRKELLFIYDYLGSYTEVQ
ncbi:hypothetical protein BJ875DRAFT_489273 [Amylocarpus encephaloides]|uniref:Uncharacterized protein n=1 Tax=Amylocarpus encephaloides TaxID=45428 RepID=A0A9P7Y7Z1_9HELO|nr:hypothetical protein BJ875DRAFT_489273 [Amylocarpus encephaloides]